MIIDCRTWGKEFPHEDWSDLRRRVFVDGVEIFEVFYVDTNAGFVRTYDAFGDKKLHMSSDAEYAGMARVQGWHVPENGIISKNIVGHIELRPFEDGK